MHDKAARDVSRMLDTPSLRHMVELAEQQGTELEETGREGHALVRHSRDGHGGSRPPEYRVPQHDPRPHEGRAADSRNLDGRTSDGRTHDSRTHDSRTHDSRTHDGRGGHENVHPPEQRGRSTR